MITQPGRAAITDVGSVGNLLGIVKCLSITTDVMGFIEWSHRHGAFSEKNNLFAGYKLTVETLIRLLYDEIERDDALGLSEDELFHRAAFAGISIHRVPSSCEKANVLWGLSDEGEHVLRARQWRPLADALHHFHQRYLDPLSSVVRDAELNSEYSLSDKDSVLAYAAQFETYVFLNDTRRGIPHGYRGPVFRSDAESAWGWPAARRQRNRFAKAFDGYKMGVQFIWSRLLGKAFESSPLAELDKARDYDEFDAFFDRIRAEVILPLERQTRAGSGTGFNDALVLARGRRYLPDSIVFRDRPKPELTPKDELESAFYWYEVQLIDGSDFDFGGVAAFIPLLVGMIEVTKQNGLADRVKVMRLIHGEKSDDRRDYSYGVLIRVGTHITDASGWILFYDCCSDRGSSSQLYSQAERHIEILDKEGLLEVSTQRIGKPEFLTYMKDRIVSLTKGQIHDLRRKT